ncbi:MAG: hypothetical protein ACO1N7_04805 [Sphingobacteriaceae bacterium]
MKNRKIYFAMLLMPLALSLSSCSNNSAKADEAEVETMDSVSTEMEKTNKELEEQVKKVEASLEKVDKKFETAK